MAEPDRVDPWAAPEFLDRIFAAAHTTHTFSNDAVDPAVIAQVYDQIRWAPTQMNSQPLRLTLVHTTAAKHQLGPHMRPGNRAKTLAAPMTIIRIRGDLVAKDDPKLLQPTPTPSHPRPPCPCTEC